MHLNLIYQLLVLALFQKCLVTSISLPYEIDYLKDEDEIIRVTEESYQLLKYGVEGHFNVLFITLDELNSETGEHVCTLCLQFEQTLRSIANIIREQKPGAPVSYFIVDAKQVPSLTKDMEITSVPHLVIYPPPIKNAIPEFTWARGEFYQYQISPEYAKDELHFGNFLAEVLDIFIEIDKGFETEKFLKYFVGSTALFVLFKKVVWPFFVRYNAAKILSILLSFAILLPSLAGYKFVEINRIPFIARNDEGNIMYFSGGTGYQFGIEVFTVSLMYIALSGLFLLLIALHTQKVQERLNDNTINIFSIIIGVALFYMFSYYTSCFDIKSPGYSYKY